MVRAGQSHNGPHVMFVKSDKSEVSPEPDIGVGDRSPTKEECNAWGELSAEESAEIRRRAAQSKQLQASFGEIVGLLMRSPQFKNTPLSDLEELVVPAITTGQFMVAEAHVKKSGFITPVAAVLWASVSEEIDRQLSDNPDQSMKLAPKDWKSGEIPWLIIAAGDQRLIKTLVERVQETILKDRTLKFWIADGGGKVVTTAATSN